MKPFVWILVAGLLLASPAQAREQTPASKDTDARRKELSRELGALVEQAVNEGLLDPAGPAGTEKGPKVITRNAAKPKDIVPEVRASTAADQTLLPQVAQTPDPIDCAQPYPLDFSEFSEITRYADIYAYREESPAVGQAGGPDAAHPGARLARAYIALDLSAEAAMTVRSARDQDAVAAYNLAVLLEGGAPPPVAYFTALAACYPEASLWQSLALIAAQDASGGPLLEAKLTAFRALPLQLRDRAAMVAIPGLDVLGQSMLAKLLIAGFTEDEINNSSQLQFSKAILGLRVGDPDAEELIGQFLIQSRFQEGALSALIRHERPMKSEIREIFFDDMVNRIEVAETDADILKDLRFVLGEMSAKSMYGPMLKLTELPSMQSAAARQELSSQLAASIERDLASEDSLLNLAAIEGLINDRGLLETAPGREALYGSATAVAVNLGFGGLGDALAAKAQGGEGVAEQRAVLAYRQKDTDDVFALAKQYPGNQKIGLTAALAAIDSNDRAKLANIEPRLSLEPETILALIEQDAATGHWILPERVFVAASKLSDKAQKLRVDRVLGLKATPSADEITGRLPMSSISAKLDRSRQSLKQLSGEAP